MSKKDTNKKVLKAVAMHDFFTRARANAGARFVLRTPDGAETDQWLDLRGIDSDDFRRANTAILRRMSERMEEAKATNASEDDMIQIRDDASLEARAALVIAWSFTEKPCTFENVVEFFREAPHIATEADKFASNRSHFLGEALKA